jgi:predicted nucleotidyltransferase component of viral defense system
LDARYLVDLTTIERIKRLAIEGLFSDDRLMDSFVLKGGNALDLVYGIAPRASIDIDLSMCDEFEHDQLDAFRMRIEHALRRVFADNGYVVFDVTLEERPRVRPPGVPDFWGGYQLSFKVISKGKQEGAISDLASLRRNAEIVGPRHKRTFKVDISKHEYCQPKDSVDMDGYLIYVYTPEMIAIEKLRAICQQTEEYCMSIGRSHRDARARDFFDVYTVIEHFGLELTSSQNLELLRQIFQVKQVPLQLLSAIAKYREFHRPDFATVTDNLKPGETVREFDYYFDYVVEGCKILTKALGIK